MLELKRCLYMRKTVKPKKLTRHSLEVLNKDFESVVQLKKIKKSKKHRDYYSY